MKMYLSAMEKPIEFYDAQLHKLDESIHAQNIRIRFLGTARLIAFLSIPLVLYVLHLSHVAFAIAMVCFVVFLYLVKLQITAVAKREKDKILHAFYGKEKTALSDWNFSTFETGEQYKKAAHPYSSDMNIFGKNALFQMVSKTHPFLGHAALATLLADMQADGNVIEQRQNAVKELRTMTTFMDNFHVLKNEQEMDASKFNAINHWLQTDVSKKQLKKMRYSVIAQLVLFVLFTGLTIAQLIPGSLLIVPFLTMSFFIQPYFKHINALLSKTDKFSDFLMQLQRLFYAIENTNFTSALLKNEQQKLSKVKTASSEMSALVNAFKQLEYRQNVIVGFLLNYSCLWDLLCLLRIEKIKSVFTANYAQWMDVINQMDAFCSLGRFGFNHPEAKFPSINNSSEFIIRCADLGHPFIVASKRVNNSFYINQSGEIKLITGANMAGKSTFLRTIGVNLVLASAGLPVFATEFEFTPVKMFTSMLASDDLSEEKSYFLSEVDRLAKMMDYLKTHPKTLLIMDEILKGTNSHDKEEGSRLFIQKLIKYKATTIIATHDLNLTQMEKQYPGMIENLCFEVEHAEENMIFDYKLRKGATQHMNAMRLMRQKGLIE